MTHILNRILIVSFVVLLFGSCKKEDILDINTNPNSLSTASATPGIVLPAALGTTASIYNNPTAGSRFVWAGLWMGHIGYSGNYAIATENLSYNITNNFEGAPVFNNIYDNIEDYDYVEKAGRTQNNTFYQAAGMLMKAYNFQTLVDLFNNVPYSQALQGTANSKPAYDNGKAIYDDLAKKMDSAILLFKQIAANANQSITGDIMFSQSAPSSSSAQIIAEATKWYQFANTVKLRLLLRQSEVNAAAAKAQASALSGGFIATDVTIQPGYLNSTGKQNPFFGSNVNVSGTYTQDLYRPGQYVVNFMQVHNDPRLTLLFKPVAGTTTTYQGNYFGEQGLPNAKTSEFGPGILKSFNQPSIVMLAAESYFLQAEAALRGWTSGDAQSLYQSGVTASFAYFGLSNANAVTYYTRVGDKETNWTATTTFQEKLALIIRQKWAALTLINELESYNDYRRLRLPPDVPLSKSPQSTGAIPNRLLYPQREYDVNSENVLTQGTVKPTDKVWWIP